MKTIRYEDFTDFQKFTDNLWILIEIFRSEPSSLYQLSKNLGIDYSNLSKRIRILEEWGLVEIELSRKGNRTSKIVRVPYEGIKILFSP